jgi:hypothetical protein
MQQVVEEARAVAEVVGRVGGRGDGQEIGRVHQQQNSRG